MIQTEAQALAARLERVWGCSFQIKTMGFLTYDAFSGFLMTEDENIFCGERILIRFVDGVLWIAAKKENQACPPFTACNTDTLATPSGQLMRKLCFLSGVSIEATAHECAEWLQHGRDLGLEREYLERLAQRVRASVR